MERLITHQTNVGVMENKNSMESVTIAIRMVIEQVNVKRNLSLKVNVTIVRNKDINLQSAKPSSGTQLKKIMKAIFEWDTLEKTM